MTATSPRRRNRQSLRVETLEDRRTPAAMLFDDFSNPANASVWSLGPNWQIGPAVFSSGQNYGNPDPTNDHSPTADNRLAGVVIGGNVPTAIAPTSYMTSPPMDTTSAPSATLNFWRWLNSDYTPFMKNTVEVFDGANWQTVFASGPSPGVHDGTWTKVAYDLTPFRNSQMRIRIGYTVDQSYALTVSGWNVDDIRVGRKPIAGADSFTTHSGNNLFIAPSALLANDSQPDGDTFAITSFDSASSHGGKIFFGGGTYSYTPPLGYHGPDSFTYTITDAYGWTATATVNVNVTDTAPIAIDDHLQTKPGQAVQFATALLGSNDIDPDGDSITITKVNSQSAQGGTITIVPAGYEYTPPAGFQGDDTVQYTLSDPYGMTTQGTLHILVGRPPTAADDTFVVTPNGSVTFILSDLLTNDSEPDNNTMSVTGIDATSAQGVSLLGLPPMPSTCLYKAPAGFHGDDTLHYTVTDSTGLSSQGIVHFLVDTAPAAQDDYFTASQGHNWYFDASLFLGNDGDADGDKLTITNVDTQSANGGAVSFNGTNIQYKSAADFYGDDKFTYTVSDALGLKSTAVVHMHVNGAPVVPDVNLAIIKDHHLTIAAGILKNNATDPEGQTLSFDLAASPASGQLKFNADASFDYQPNPGFTGTDRFTYVVVDGINVVVGVVKIYVADSLPAPAQPILQATSDTGADSTDGLTDVRDLQLTGTAPANATIDIFLDGNFLLNIAPNTAGNWYASTGALAVGRHSITTAYVDLSGNVGPQSVPLQVVIVGAPVGRVAIAAVNGMTSAASKLQQSVAVYGNGKDPLFNLSPGWKVADGIRIATGDVTGDGVADIALTPTAGPLLGTVRVYDGMTGALLMNQVPIATGVKTSIALGDVNNDGYADLIAAGLSGKSAGRVVGISGKTQLPLFDWAKAPGTTVHNVTVGDVNGDLIADVLLQQTQKPFGTDVVAFNVADRTIIRRYDGSKFGLTATSRVAVGRITSDNIADLIVSNTGKVAQIVIVNGQDGIIANYFKTPGNGTGTRAVAAADLNGDGFVEIVIGSGKGAKSDGVIHVIDPAGLPWTRPTFDPLGTSFHGTLEV